jgi:hypothetical protein
MRGRQVDLYRQGTLTAMRNKRRVYGGTGSWKLEAGKQRDITTVKVALARTWVRCEPTSTPELVSRLEPALRMLTGGALPGITRGGRHPGAFASSVAPHPPPGATPAAPLSHL